MSILAFWFRRNQLSPNIPKFLLSLSNQTSEAMDDLFAYDCVQKHITTQLTVKSVPPKSMQSFFLDAWAFDFSESSKYGAVGRFPTNHQYSMHFQSFLDRGLESHREAIDVKFTKSLEDRVSYEVSPFSVGFVDGQCKALILQSILDMLHVLVPRQNNLWTFEPVFFLIWEWSLFWFYIQHIKIIDI